MALRDMIVLVLLFSIASIGISYITDRNTFNLYDARYGKGQATQLGLWGQPRGDSTAQARAPYQRVQSGDGQWMTPVAPPANGLSTTIYSRPAYAPSNGAASSYGSQPSYGQGFPTSGQQPYMGGMGYQPYR